MLAAPSPIDALFEAREATLRLRNELTQWQQRNAPEAPEAALNIARLAEAVVSQMDIELERLEKTAPIDRDGIRAIRERAKSVEILTNLLYGSARRSIHPVLSPSVRAALDSVGASTDVLVAGTRDVSYELLSFSREQFAPLVDVNSLDKFKWPILVVRVPTPPFEWPLYHVLVYHEVGHALHMKPGSFKLDPLLPARFQRPAGQLDQAALLQARLGGLYARALACWAEEIFSDSVALLLAGPAYVAAFCRFLGRELSLDIASKTHPPLAYRIKSLFSRFSGLGFSESEFSGRWSSLFDEWRAAASAATVIRWNQDSAHDQEASLLPDLLAAFDDVADRAFAAARTAVGDRVYTHVHLAEDRNRAADLLTLHVPPMETVDERDEHHPLSAARIFATVWAAYLSGDAALAARGPDGAVQLGRLLLGALDGSEALRIWKELA